MEYNITCSGPSGLFVVKTVGSMTGAGLIRMAESILSHQRWIKDSSVVFDNRELDFSAATLADLEEIRKFHKKNDSRIGCGKSAIVLGEGMAAKWSALWAQGEKADVKNMVLVFEDFDKALNWIQPAA